MNHNQLELKILDLSVTEDRNTYGEIVSNVFHNPYYHIEYLQHHKNATNRIIAFLLEKKECIAIMPMILSPIQNTGYSDATSPYGYNGPLFKNGISEDDISCYWGMIDQWYMENKIVTEFIRFSLTNNHINYTGKNVKTLTNVCGILKESFDDQWETFDKKVRNNYRKAISSGLSFKLHDQGSMDMDLVDSFYKIYYKTMQRNNASKFLFFSAEYFHNLVLNHKGDFTIGMVYHEGQPISTELHIHYKDSVYAFLGGTDSDFFHTRPNDFLRVEVIKWAIGNDKKKYVLGGGIKDDDGLYKSKKAYFPKDEDCIFYTGRKVINQQVYDSLTKKAIEERSLDKNDTFFPLYRKP